MPATAISAGFAGAWPAVASSVPEARRSALSYLRGLGRTDLPFDGIALVLTEAVANAVVHAYVGRQPGEVRVAVEVEEDGVHLVVEDDGRGLLPRVDSPGLGLGLPLIATLSDRFDTWTDMGRGTRLCAYFSPGPGTGATNA